MMDNFVIKPYIKYPILIGTVGTAYVLREL